MFWDNLNTLILIYGLICILYTSTIAGAWKKKMGGRECWYDTLPNAEWLTIVFHVGLICLLITIWRMWK
jgi:hypothetical protein